MFMKNIEGPWVRYSLNNCGYREDVPCGPKPAGTIRGVIIGSSIAFGLHVPYDKFFATQATPELSKIWHHPVEFQNLAYATPIWTNSDASLKEMVGLSPDAVFLVLSPFDLVRMDEGYVEQRGGTAKPPTAPPVNQGKWNWTNVRLALRESRFLFMAQHFMLEDEKFFIHAFEDYADPFDVSRVPSPPLVEQRFARMDERVGKVAEYARIAGAPCFMVALPNRAEAALISRGIQLPHLDAYIFANRMKEIALKHGIGYIDTVPLLEKTANAEKLFYSVDGHPGVGANTLMADAVIDYFRQHGALCPAKKVQVK
jgi:hypothetical protein